MLLKKVVWGTLLSGISPYTSLVFLITPSAILSTKGEFVDGDLEPVRYKTQKTQMCYGIE